MWKELVAYGDFENKADFFDYLRERNRDGEFDDFKGIADNIISKGWKAEARKTLRGYYLLEILDYADRDFLKMPLWKHFEDLVGELLRIALAGYEHLKVVSVDKWPGFRGLDWIVVNERKSDGWRLGIQCKKNIWTSASRKRAWANPWGGTSAVRLVEHAANLENKWGIHKRFALVASYAWRYEKSEKNRWERLRYHSDWDFVSVFEARRSFNKPYSYSLTLEEFDNVVGAAFE